MGVQRVLFVQVCVLELQFPFLLARRKASHERTCAESLGEAKMPHTSRHCADGKKVTVNLALCTFLHFRTYPDRSHGLRT